MIDCATLKALLFYDPVSGVFVNRVDRGTKAKAGAVAGHLRTNQDGLTYHWITILGRTHGAHRLAWLYMTGEFPKKQIDHINGNGTDNRFENLRECDQSENNENFGSMKSDPGRFVGIHFDKTKGLWIAGVRKNGVQKRVLCKTEEDARLARTRLKAEFHKFNPIQRTA